MTELPDLFLWGRPDPQHSSRPPEGAHQPANSPPPVPDASPSPHVSVISCTRPSSHRPELPQAGALRLLLPPSGTPAPPAEPAALRCGASVPARKPPGLRRPARPAARPAAGLLHGNLPAPLLPHSHNTLCSQQNGCSARWAMAALHAAAVYSEQKDTFAVNTPPGSGEVPASLPSTPPPTHPVPAALGSRYQCDHHLPDEETESS